MKNVLARKIGLAVLGGATILTGCRSPQDTAREAAERVADQSKAVIEKQKNALGESVITTKNSVLQGNDSKGRLLWRLSFKEGRLNSEGKDDSLGGSPRGGQLLGASATLFRDGREESSFKSRQMTFASTPRGLMLTMTGGVNASTSTTQTVRNSSTSSTSTSSARTPSPTRVPVRIAAPIVRVDVQARQVRAEGGVRMTQGPVVVTAKQLAADTSLGVARVGGGVLGVAPNGRITAKNAAWNWKTGRVQATGGVQVASSQNGATKLTGATLNADTRASRGEVRGGVRAVSSDGGTASAGRVLFNWANNSLGARDDVTLQKNGATLRAARIDSDSDLNRAQASGGVTLQKDDATISAAHLQAFDRATRVVASGGVRVQRSDGTLTANRATVWLSEKRAEASGDVTIARQGATLRANNAQGWASGRAVASGDVRLVRDDVTMNAGRLESDNLSDGVRSRVLASGGVTARGRGGEIQASSVVWGGGRAVASGDVRLVRDGNVVRGNRLTTDQRFAQIVLSGDVGGTLKNDARFSSGALTWTRLSNGQPLPRGGSIVAQNGVVLRQGDVTLRGARFEANGDGSEARMTGGVVASDAQGAQVRAQNAVYNAASGKIVARGNVFYRDASGNTLRGTDLEARVENGRLQNATLNNVTGSRKTSLFSGKTLFGD